MKKLFALATLLLTTTAGAQLKFEGCYVNGWPCWMAYPAAADDGKCLSYNLATATLTWVACAGGADGVIGNEVVDVSNATLKRDGAGTAGDPYTLGLNLANANTWTATQTFNPSSGASLAGASNVDFKLFSSGTGGTLLGTVTTVGSKTACSSAGTTTITCTTHGLTLLAGDIVRVTAPTTPADTGFYRLVSSGPSTLVVSRPLAGSDSDLSVTVYRTGMAIGPNGRLYNTSTLTGSRGTMFGTVYSPQVNQSGTAGYTALYVDATQTATGSGTKRLLDLLADGTSMFSVSNAGAVKGVDSTWNKPNITTTLTSAVSLANVTPATAGVPVQYSPAIRLEGHGWNTAASGSDSKHEWYYLVVPSSGTVSSSSLIWQSSVDGASPITALTLSRLGTLTAAGTVAAARFIAPFANINDYYGTLTGTGSAGTSQRLAWQTYTNSSGVKVAVEIAPVYNQSSTAGATDLLINRTETAVGSGTQYLINAQVGGASRFSVDNIGRVVARNYMVQLTADATVQVGNVVMPDAGTDGRFDLNTGSATSAIGVLAGTGASAAGTAYNIAVDGIAYVTPTTGTAVTRGHYLVMSATAGYVDDSATLGAAGLTIGKALYSEAMYTAASADVNLTNDTFKLSSAPGWAVNDPVIYYNGGGASATGLTTGNTYWVQSITTDTITVAATRGGSKIDISGTGNNAQYFLRLPQAIINIQ